MTVRDNAFFTRNELVSFLERKMIQTRMLFAGNLTKHPCFDGLREKPSGYRTVGPLVNTDLVMNNTLWIGLYPGLTQDMIAYVVETLQSFARGSSS